MKYKCTFTTTISLTVVVDPTRDDLADDPELAADVAWEHAQDYLDTLMGDHVYVVAVDASLDGIGADKVEEVAP